MPLSPDDVFRDYQTAGVPASGPYKPPKADIRQLLKEIAGGTAAVGDYLGAWSAVTNYIKGDIVENGGSLWYSKRANLNVTPVEGADWTLFLSGATVADGAITAAKLASNAVETAKINNLAVTAAKLAADSVTTAKILDEAVTAAKLSSTIYALPSSPIADLRTFMDLEYGVGGWTGRTGVGTGSDIAPAVEAALDALSTAYGRGVLLIPPAESGGAWLCNAAIDATKLPGHKIRGIGSQASKIVFNSNSGILFQLNGAGGFTGGGVEGMALFIEDGYPTSTAKAIELNGDATYQPDQTIFNDLYITALGTSYWYDAFLIFGQDRTAPQGVRVLEGHNLQLFRARNTGFSVYNGVQCTFDNVGVYAGSGNGNNAYIGGGGASNTNSIQISLTRATVAGELNVGNATELELRGLCGSLAITSVDYAEGWLSVSGSTTGSFGASSNVTLR